MAKKNYVLVVDLRRCVGCTSCQISCKMENDVPFGSFRSRVDFADTGKFPDAERFFFPKICNQCDDPPCVEPCPVKGATYKRENGVVAVNRELCIGCGRCVDACPYSARFQHLYETVRNNPAGYAKKVFEVRGKKAADLHIADKCDYCSPRLAAGIEEPACVRNCAGSARIFGDLNDPKSDVAKLQAKYKFKHWNPDYGTKPRTAFITDNSQVFTAADGEINK